MAKDTKKKKKKSFSGDYKGPDVFKGNKSLLSRWRKAGKPKAGSSKFAKEFPAKSKLVKKSNKKKAGSVAKGKGSGSGESALERKATQLSREQYAGAISELKGSMDFNESQYDRAQTSRRGALTNELSSQQTAGQITTNAVSGLKGEALAQFIKDRETKNALFELAQSNTKATNSNLLTQYQNSMRARGLDPSQASEMTANAQKNLGYQDEIKRITNEADTSAEQNARIRYDTLLSRVEGQKNNAAANARAGAQRDIEENENTYLSRRHELENSLKSTKLDRGASRTNTLLTLQKEKQLAAQEAAQLRLEQSIAGMKNEADLAKVAASNYFKETELDLKKSDMLLKDKELALKIKKFKKDGKLEEAKLLQKIADQNAKNRISEAKTRVDYTNKNPSAPRSSIPYFGSPRDNMANY